MRSISLLLVISYFSGQEWVAKKLFGFIAVRERASSSKSWWVYKNVIQTIPCLPRNPPNGPDNNIFFLFFFTLYVHREIINLNSGCPFSFFFFLLLFFMFLMGVAHWKWSLVSLSIRIVADTWNQDCVNLCWKLCEFRWSQSAEALCYADKWSSERGGKKKMCPFF